MALLIAAAITMTGLAKGVTMRLKLNDFAASFLIFVIVLLNVRGGVRLNENYTLSIGGVLSVVITVYMLLKRSELARDVVLALRR